LKGCTAMLLVFVVPMQPVDATAPEIILFFGV